MLKTMLAVSLALASTSALAGYCPRPMLTDPLHRCVCPAGYLRDWHKQPGSAGACLIADGSGGFSGASVSVDKKTGAVSAKPSSGGNDDGGNDDGGGGNEDGGGGTPGGHCTGSCGGGGGGPGNPGNNKPVGNAGEHPNGNAGGWGSGDHGQGDTHGHIK